MSEFDTMSEAEMLLNVIEKCAGHPGRFAAIASEATNRLTEINDELRKAQMAKAAAEAEALAAAQPKAIPSSETETDDDGGDDPDATSTNAAYARRL